MAFDHPRGAHAAEAGVALQLGDGPRAAVTHSRAQASDELVNEIAQRTAVRDAPFHALGHEFSAPGVGLLSVAVGRALNHRSHAPHAAIGLVATALVDDRLAW